MTLEIDLERAAEVVRRLERNVTVVESARRQAVEVGARMGVEDSLVPALVAADAAVDAMGTAGVILQGCIEQAGRADGASSDPTSFSGGTLLCSAIQVVSPIPARPSTSGATGAVDLGGVAWDAGSLAGSVDRAVLAGNPITAVVAVISALVDLLFCRLGVGSGAAISTRTIVDEDGEPVYESSRSKHKYLTGTGEVLHPDERLRDEQLWRVEHSNELGYLMEPYPGDPAYPVD